MATQARGPLKDFKGGECVNFIPVVCYCAPEACVPAASGGGFPNEALHEYKARDCI